MSERDDDSFGDLLRQVARAPAIDPRALAAGDLVGRTLAHFRVVARIGAGGMGVVYEAEDERLGRRVALKVLSAKYAGDDAGRALLLGEARAAAAVTHPSIAASEPWSTRSSRLPKSRASNRVSTRSSRN